MRKAKKIFLALGFATLCFGCRPAIHLGPVNEKTAIFIHTVSESGEVIQVGRVAENAKVRVEYLDKDGHKVFDEQDIGGWGLVHPNALETEDPKKEEDR